MWTLNAFGDAGPASAAEAAVRSPIAGSEQVRDALALLADRFGDLHDQGPSNYAKFFLGAAGSGEERARLRRFAFGVVQEFLGRWAELRP